ncbi:protein BTN1 [Cryptococcus depauperatus]
MQNLPLTVINPMADSTHYGPQPRESASQEDVLEELNQRSSEDNEDVGECIAADDNSGDMSKSAKYANKRLFAAFMIFGLLNNVLYVVILSAALDLVSADTPKGVVAFFNIFPALITKVVWPLVSNGRIQYTRRVGFCTLCSWLGILTISFSSSLAPRLLGISLASLSSGLGELTFLQLTTTLPSRESSTTALGAWSSGTGFAGIAGAGIWWLLRGLGVKRGLGISSFLPLFFPVTYTYIMPPFSHLTTAAAAYQSLPMDFDPPRILVSTPSSEYVPLHQPLLSASSETEPPCGQFQLRLSAREKLNLLKPLVIRYMLPLCAVYVEEYVINSGVAPTLVFPVPTSGLWSRLFKSTRDYYPFWSLTYQTFVFLSRSSLSLGLPPLPKRFLPLPAIVQFVVLSLLCLQAKSFIFSSPAYTPPSIPPSSGVDHSITIVFLLICLEGLCGGSGYVNTFYHVGHEGDEENGNEEKKSMEKEFRIGAVGAADSTGILFASLISMPLEISLCNQQVEQGRRLCRDL